MANISFISSQCIASESGSIVSASEKGKTFRIKNPSHNVILKIHVDNCVIKGNTNRCDYIFIEKSYMCHIIELKGRDISHAFIQLRETINTLKGSFFTSGDTLKCYIVSSAAPAMSASNGAKKLNFIKQTGVPVIIKNRLIELTAI